jgi:hypothetical protein
MLRHHPSLLRVIVVALVVVASACDGATAPTVQPESPPNDAPTAPAGVGAIRYTCDGPPGFLPGLLDGPATAETEAHPSAAVLRSAIAEVGPDIDMLPEAGYWLVHRDATEAQYLARDRAGELVSATIEATAGAWRLVGWGGCRPTILLPGLSVASWVLDPDAPAPLPDDTTFTALVTERQCTGGQPMGARLRPPLIELGDDEVLVAFAATPLQGDAFDCQGNPSMRVVVELPETLGERRLLDGAFFPPADPAEPPG